MTKSLSKKKQSAYWQPNYRADKGMMEWICPCGVGHDNSTTHGCCGKSCCARDDYPGLKEPCPHCALPMEDHPTQTCFGEPDGEMAEVPWVRVDCDDGRISMHNAAHIETIEYEAEVP